MTIDRTAASYEQITYVTWPGRFRTDISPLFYGIIGWNVNVDNPNPGDPSIQACEIPNVHSFDALGSTTTSFTGFGMPPVDYITSGGPCIDGINLDGYRLLPRQFTVSFYVEQHAREEYWKYRRRMLGIMRPNDNIRLDLANPALTAQETTIANALGINRGLFGPGVIRVSMANGDSFEIDAAVTDGLVFEPRDQDNWGESIVEDSVTFTAHDPIWRRTEPEQINGITTGGVDPIQQVDYCGTFESYPILITDPLPVGGLQTYRIAINNATVQINVPVGVLTFGDRVIFDMRSGRKQIIAVRNTGFLINLMGYMDPAASEVDSLRFEPQDQRNRNLMQVTSNVINQYSVNYYEKFIGI